MRALIIGASGATGRELLTLLLADETISEVHSFTRKSSQMAHPKLHTHIVDFEHPEQWKELLQGEVAFSCLGTTLAQAGSKEAQWRVDYDYQYNFAKGCKANGVPTFVLVSAAGAKATSSVFYNKMKGQLEDAIKSLDFTRLIIFQPSVLIRPQSDRRGENMGVKVISFFNKIGLFRRYKPMPTTILAEKILKSTKILPKGIHTFALSDIFGI
ncbi:oxidoreductase [Capnocytophaga sp. HP1101]